MTTFSPVGGCSEAEMVDNQAGAVELYFYVVSIIYRSHTKQTLERQLRSVLARPVS